MRGLPDEAMNALITPVMEALTEEAALDLEQDEVVACQLRLLAESGFEVVPTGAINDRLTDVGMGGHRSLREAVEALILSCMEMERLRDEEYEKRKAAEAAVTHQRQWSERWVPPQVSDLIDKAGVHLQAAEEKCEQGWNEHAQSRAATASAYADVARAVIALEGV